MFSVSDPNHSLILTCMFRSYGKPCISIPAGHLRLGVLRVAVVHLSELQDQLCRVVSGQRRHRDDRLMDAAPQSLQVPPGLRQVHLVGHDGTRSVGQLRIVPVQLEAQLLELLPGLGGRHVQHEQQQPTALDVSEERDAEPTVQMSAGNQPGNISHCHQNEERERNQSFNS